MGEVQPGSPRRSSSGFRAATAPIATTTVRPASRNDDPAWEEFVATSPQATFFHKIGWRTIFEQVLRLQTHYLIAWRESQVVGILPLVHQNEFLSGNALISAPFCVQGGPLAADEEAGAALDAAALALMEELKCSYLEFRSRKATRLGWKVRSDLYATFSRPILPDEKANLLAIPRKQRAVVRKTIEGALVSEVDETIDRLYRVYAESVRNLGTPVFPKRYFSELKRVFRDDCDIVIVVNEGAPVSAVMNFYFRDRVMPYYGGGTAAARRIGANDFLYWEVLRRALVRGYRTFDFGRSKAHTGAFAFKKNWGFEPEWLEYEFQLRAGSSLPNKNPNNPKYRLFIETWKRLPLPVANFLGPFLIRGLG
jgi:FemAB-related protein (PEP-CTERM system-associated)